MDDIKLKRECDVAIWAHDIEKTTSGIWMKDNPFIDAELQKIKVDCKSWLELKRAGQLIKRNIDIGDIVDTSYGRGVVKCILPDCFAYVIACDVADNIFMHNLCTDKDIKFVIKKRNKNKKEDVETMENKEIDRIRELALNIINKVRNYKIETTQDKCNKKIEEVTKSAEVIKVVEMHTEQLNKDVNKLLGRDNDDNFIGLIIGSMNKIKFKVNDNYLTEDEKNKKQKMLDDFQNEKKQIHKQFNNIVDSLQLCTTVDQINEFLDNQGFRVNGLIVSPEDWKG